MLERRWLGRRAVLVSTRLWRCLPVSRLRATCIRALICRSIYETRGRLVRAAIHLVSITTYSKGSVEHLGGKSASCCIEKDTRDGTGDQLAQVIGLQSDRSQNNLFASMSRLVDPGEGKTDLALTYLLDVASSAGRNHVARLM